MTDEGLGHSRGGITSEIHLCVDGNGLPLSFVVTARQCSDAANIGPVLDAISVPEQGEDVHANGRPSYVSIMLMALVIIGDRSRSGASAAFAPNDLMRRKAGYAKAVGEDRPPRFEAEAYKGRSVVERVINRLKDFRADATRYDKRGHNFFTAVLVATIILWLL